MTILLDILHGSWAMLLEASAYVLFGLLVSGLLKAFLTPPGQRTHRLGIQGSFARHSVAALLLRRSARCGVPPAAASLKKQGASNGATTAFLISTSESGVDSISITYALLDPLMTVARPIAAFFFRDSRRIDGEFFSQPGRKEWLRESSNKRGDSCGAISSCSPAEPLLHFLLVVLEGGFPLDRP
jgi:uncharacterized protein